MVIKLEHAHPWAVMTELAERLYCPIAEWTRPNHPPCHCSDLQHGITMDDINTEVFLQRVVEQLNALDTEE